MTTLRDWQRADILDLVGPGRYILVVPKWLRDRVLAQYDFKPEDVPGLVEYPTLLRQGVLGLLNGQIIVKSKLPLAPTPKPLPYPPRKKGRYAR